MGNVNVFGAGGVTSINGVSGAVYLGTRNLLIGTKDFSGDKWVNLDKWAEDGTYNGFAVMKRLGDWKGIYQELPVEPGAYTFSFYIRASTGAHVYVYFDSMDSASPDAQIVEFRPNLGNPGQEWTRISYTFHVKNTAPAGYLGRMSISNSIGNETIWTCGWSLVKGNVLTDWTPAPEDIESRLAAIEAKLGITADPPVIDGPEMEEMNMDENHVGGGYNLYIVSLLPALIGGGRHE